jgi:hypothetical protein
VKFKLVDYAKMAIDFIAKLASVMAIFANPPYSTENSLDLSGLLRRFAPRKDHFTLRDGRFAASKGANG